LVTASRTAIVDPVFTDIIEPGTVVSAGASSAHSASPSDASRDRAVDATDVESVIARLASACRAIHGDTANGHAAAAHTLRAIREAGRLLGLVQRSPGGRPPENASTGLTSYQRALKCAGISRQTANRWRRVADIPDTAFDAFIGAAALAGTDVTVKSLLRTCTQTSHTGSTVRTVTLSLSDNEYQTFKLHVGVLGAVYFAHTTTETVMAVLGRTYGEWLAGQNGGPRSRRP